MFISDWIKQREINKQKIQDELNKKSEDHKAMMQERLEKTTLKMLNEHCPIAKQNCIKDCVHYENRTVQPIYSIHFRFTPPFQMYGCTKPRCKLWGKQ